MVLVGASGALRFARDAHGFGAAQRFAGDEKQSLRPVLAQRHMDEARMLGAQAAEGAGIRGSAQDHGVRRLQRAQDGGELAVTDWADDDEIVRRALVIAPEGATENCDGRSMALGLPTSGQQTRKLSFVGENQYVRVSQ